MRIEALGVAVNGPHSALLAPTNATIRTGQVTVVDGPPGAGHTALSLVLGGRLVPSAGRILVDGVPNGQRLRDEVAVVDVPDVSEPDEVVSLATTIGEEMAMAGQRARMSDVRNWLTQRNAISWRHTRIEDVPAEVRLRLLADVAAHRPGVRAVVLCCPDRYGTDAQTALEIAHEVAERGLAVCLQLASNTARAFGDSHATIGGDK